jgi:hypothetical protein
MKINKGNKGKRRKKGKKKMGKARHRYEIKP